MSRTGRVICCSLEHAGMWPIQRPSCERLHEWSEAVATAMQSAAKAEGKKLDEGKPPLGLLPVGAHELTQADINAASRAGGWVSKPLASDGEKSVRLSSPGPGLAPGLATREDLEADNARLRALIKQVERLVEFDTCATFCPWCEACSDSPSGAPTVWVNGAPRPAGKITHKNTCPAFTPDGAVR